MTKFNSKSSMSFFKNWIWKQQEHCWRESFKNLNDRIIWISTIFCHNWNNSWSCRFNSTSWYCNIFFSASGKVKITPASVISINFLFQWQFDLKGNQQRFICQLGENTFHFDSSKCTRNKYLSYWQSEKLEMTCGLSFMAG